LLSSLLPECSKHRFVRKHIPPIYTFWADNATLTAGGMGRGG